MRDSEFVPYVRRTGYLLNRVPPQHMRRLHKRAVKENTSVVNLAARILSERCGLPFEPSRRPLINHTNGTALSLRLPPAVLDCVREEADDRHVTMRTVILDALSHGLGLKPPPPDTVDPAKRPGRPRTERTA